MRKIKLEKVDDSYNVVIDDQVVVNLSALETWILQRVIKDNLDDILQTDNKNTTGSARIDTWKRENF